MMWRGAHTYSAALPSLLDGGEYVSMYVSGAVSDAWWTVYFLLFRFHSAPILNLYRAVLRRADDACTPAPPPRGLICELE